LKTASKFPLLLEPFTYFLSLSLGPGDKFELAKRLIGDAVRETTLETSVEAQIEIFSDPVGYAPTKELCLLLAALFLRAGAVLLGESRDFTYFTEGEEVKRLENTLEKSVVVF
jgi:hypothetical protein